MKKYWLIIVLFVVLIGAVVAWVMIDKAAKKKEKDQQQPTTPTDTTSQSAASSSNVGNTVGSNVVVNTITGSTSNYPIKYMKFHEDAKLLQQALGFTGKNVDGKIGSITLGEWQKYKVVDSNFTINDRASLDYYIYEISEKKAGRTPLGWTAYFTKKSGSSAGSNGAAAANNSLASNLTSLYLAPLKLFGL